MSELSRYKDAHWRIGVYRSLVDTMTPEEGIPASHEVLDQVVEFLALVEAAGFEEPSICMGEGDISVIWNPGRLYISADFDGTPTYIALGAKGCEFLFDEEEDVKKISPQLMKYLSNQETNNNEK